MENSKADTSERKQTDLAEGEAETVEESRRIHQQKAGLPFPSPNKDEDDEPVSHP
jgi:hypothetical protein